MKCDRCGLEKAEACLNGNIPNEDRSQARMCPNLSLSLRYEDALKRIHPMAKDARAIKSSPLFTPKANAHSESGIDLTRKNVYIQGITWGQFMPHLKLIQLCKNIKIRVVTDGDLRDIFVGDKSYKAKPVARRDKEEAINGLGGLLELNDDLLIVRVGFLGHTNKAGAGLLHETLLYRAAASKPCWIFESSHISVTWTFSKGSEVTNMLAKSYQEVCLSSSDPPSEDLLGLNHDGPTEIEGPSEYGAAVPEDEDVGLPMPLPTPTTPKTRVVTNLEDLPAAPAGGGGDLLNFGDGKKKYKNKKGWS